MEKQSITALGPNNPDDGDAERQRRGILIAALTKIKKDEQGYRVPSQSDNGTYTVNLDGDSPVCTCPDFVLAARPCKHIYGVLLSIQREELGEHGQNEGLKELPIRKTYPQNWESYDSAQTHELEHFDPLLWELCRHLVQPRHRFARPPLPIADVAYAVVTKAQRGMSRRRSMTDIRRAHQNAYVDHVPSDSSISRYLNSPDLIPVLKWLIIKSALPLATVEHDFAIDSTGFASTNYDRWFSHKWGKVVKETQWVKAHLLCGVKTKVVVAADISEAAANDSPYLKRLVEDIQHEDYNIEELSADKAYLSKSNFEFAETLEVDLYVPFKVNSRRQNPKRKRSGAWERAYDFFTYRHDEFLEHYHKRSISETVMHMIKAKYGAFIRSKTPVAQYNEVLAKVLCHNIYVLIQQAYELGIEDELQRWVSEAISCRPDDRTLSLAA